MTISKELEMFAEFYDKLMSLDKSEIEKISDAFNNAWLDNKNKKTDREIAILELANNCLIDYYGI